ncbi:MAG: hypothetical protein KAT88_01610 [Spirochaetes bacterium]|nr:hypothetical protein [Spirochaetota bacterium]
MKRVGIDIGSLYLGGVIIEDGNIVDVHYREHKGDISGELEELLGKPGYRTFDSIGVSGNFLHTGKDVRDSTLSAIEGIKFLAPESRNVFSIGGETFSLILYDEKRGYREHAVNSPCAAGTGSFIEQQAERLHLTVSDLAARALRYKGKTPVIATRCAVFAKTDITHAMQEGYSLDAICAGLCEGIARNVLDVLVKGREIITPVAVVGGVSLNQKIVDAIQDILQNTVFVPECSQVAGAVGAALLGNASSLKLDSITPGKTFQRNIRPPLELKLTGYPDFNEFSIYNLGDVEVFIPENKVTIENGIYIGIDIGSTSTKALLLNESREVAGGFYTSTGGDPVGAVKKLISTVKSTFKGEKIILLGAGTTGSGRKMINALFNADLEVNEITAHAKAAVFLSPDVDTIIEIGGQDSKFTRIRGGDVYYSNMNYVCAAGTGSFIEEQARRLGVGLSDFSNMALGAEAPYTSDRCTVYMERDLGVLLTENWSKEALAAAVLNSVRDNYLAKVVGRSSIGDYVVFQGATARNKALIASFEQHLKKPVHVSPFCHLTGAMGAALLCLEAGMSDSHFIWDISDIKLEKEVCRLCSNNCLLTVFIKSSRKTGWGMKCGREYSDAEVKKPVKSGPEKRFKEAMGPLLRPRNADSRRKTLTIGIPNALYNVEYLPLWYSFLSFLGFTVKITKPSRMSLAEGKKAVNSDFCAPMILSHGYIKQLLDDKADYLFYPAIVNEKDTGYSGELLFKNKTNDAYFCYYSQYLPTVTAKLTSFDVDSKLISPLIYFNHKSIEQITIDIYEEMKPIFADLDHDELKKAFVRAYEEFTKAKKSWAQVYGKEGLLLNGKNLQIALMGRPYVLFDPVLNLGIPGKLEELGADVFWQDEFPLDGYELTYANKFYERMHWYYGKKIIRLAEYVARSDNLFAVFLTCFRCSPDSFLTSYVKDIMTHYNRPFLFLQLDEYSSDVGYTTRIEAGIRSFENYMNKKNKPFRTIPAAGSPTWPSAAGSSYAGLSAARLSTVTRARNDRLENGDTVLMPYLDQLISRFWTDCFIRAGYTALLLDSEEKSLNTGYQYVNGGECMPVVSIAGSVIEKVKNENLDPEKAFLYIPTVCMACNFPQFPILADLVFHSAGLKGLKIGLINSMAPGKILPHTLAIKIFESYIAGCIIYKMYYRIKPYEEEKGKTDNIFQRSKENISDAILTGKDLRSALSESASMFRNIGQDLSGGRKPRIGLIGDLYVKYNEVVNQKIQVLVDELGGELIVPSMTEYPFHFYDADIRLFGEDPRHYKLLRTIEHRYEKIAADIIDDQLEPDFAECVKLMDEYKIRHYIAGETSINVGRALYYLRHKYVDAIIHINPMFCCPGVVTSSIYRKIQEDFDIPIIDIFYDGTGNPNRVLIPHLHYLRQKKAIAHK